MENKLKTEINARHLGSMGTCRVGLEIHFKEAEGFYDNQIAVSKQRKKRDQSCTGFCICIDTDDK